MEKQGGAGLDKGALAEECFREYFRNLGAFVLRGVPVREGQETVTDVDLWVYTRVTAHIRHISIVDIKNKKRGKPFERIVWVKGLQRAVGADEAIIASSGLSERVEGFAHRMAVRVVTRAIYDAVLRRYAKQDKRLSGEEVNEAWKRTRIGRGNLRSQMDGLKSAVSREIDFRTLNTWLDEAASLTRIMVERERGSGPITRSVYLCCALVAVAADFLGRTHSFAANESREKYFLEGMLFGRHDGDAKKAYVEFAESAVTEFLDSSGASAAKVRSGLEEAIRSMPVQGLAQFFGRPQASTDLWNAALALEKACYAKTVSAPKDLESVEAKKVIGLISDYAGVKRRDVLGSGEHQQELNLLAKSGEIVDGLAEEQA